jgi:hypothetical protein
VAAVAELGSLDVRALIIVTCAFVLSGHTGAAAPSRSFDLGLLTNYYHDCPASRGPHAAYMRKVLRRALAGDHAAMRTVIMHDGLFSTGDNEGYSEVPQALLRMLRDDQYGAFVIRQPPDVQEAALAVYPERLRAFDRRFPKTSRLYHERLLR